MENIKKLIDTIAHPKTGEAMQHDPTELTHTGATVWIAQRAREELAELQQRLAAAEAKIPQWIPVSERLPNAGQKVIAFYRNMAGFPCQIIAEYIHPRTRICNEFYDERVDYDFDYDEETDTEWVKAGWIEHIYNWDDLSSVDVPYDVEFWMPRLECPVKEDSGKGE